MDANNVMSADGVLVAIKLYLMVLTITTFSVLVLIVILYEYKIYKLKKELKNLPKRNKKGVYEKR